MDSIMKLNGSLKRGISIGLAFVLVALLFGVYFLFKPFPGGPGLEVKTNAPVAASIVGLSAYANPGNQLNIEALRYPMHQTYANPAGNFNIEALRYPMHRYGVNIEALRYPMHQK